MNGIKHLALAFIVVSAAIAQAETTLDYVQSGLVAHWDAIENAGRGQHSSTIAAWKDLVGDNDILIPDWVKVEDEALYSIGATTHDCPTLAASAIASTNVNVTIEVVTKCIAWTAGDSYGACQSVFVTPFGYGMGYRLQAENGFYHMLATDAQKASLYTWAPTGKTINDRHTFSAAVSKSTAANAVYMDGAAATGVSYGGYQENCSSGWSFFCNNRSDIRVYAIRLYDRLLTAEEIAANRRVDVERFDKLNYLTDGKLKFSEVTDNGATVAYMIPSTAVLPVEASFVSGFKRDLADGRERALGTVDRVGMAESEVAFSRGPTTYARVELTDAEGNRFLSEVSEIPKVGELRYVRRNLIAQWDGIDNAGTGIHLDSPNGWVDSVRGNTIPIPEWVRVESNAVVSIGSITGQAPVTLDSLAGLYSANVTIEVAAQRIRWNKTDSYGNLQCLVSSPYAQLGYRYADGIYALVPQESGKFFLKDTGNGSRGGGSMNTFAVTGAKPIGYAKLYQQGAAVALSGVSYQEDASTVWGFFGNPRTELRIFAIRVYDDNLTEAELKTNALVDVRRFIDGVQEPQAIVVVESDQMVGEALATGGYYPLAGEDVISKAPECVVTEDAVFTRRGWTRWEESEGEWTEVERGQTGEVTIVPNVSVRQRLTWHWFKTMKLTDRLVRLKSISSCGAGAFNTDYYPNPKTHLELDIKISGKPDIKKELTIFSSSASSGASADNFAANFPSNNDEWFIYWWLDKAYTNGGAVKKKYYGEQLMSSRQTVTVDAATGKTSWGGVEFTAAAKTGKESSPLYLLGREDHPYNASTMVLYGAKISEEGKLLHDYVPARYTESGRIGLYDRVTEEFLESALASVTPFGYEQAEEVEYLDYREIVAIEGVCNGAPVELGAPILPYGITTDLAVGDKYPVGQAERVRGEDGHKYRVGYIDRYLMNQSTGEWVFDERIRGSSLMATYTGVPVKYVLGWIEQKGLILIFGKTKNADEE